MGKGFDTFMENPYWKGIYENAPSNSLRRYFQIRFDHSGFVKGAPRQGSAAEKELQEIPLTKEDVQYIQSITRIGNARMFYKVFIDKLAGEHEGKCVRASMFQIEEWNPYYRQEGK